MIRCPNFKQLLYGYIRGEDKADTIKNLWVIKYLHINSFEYVSLGASGGSIAGIIYGSSYFGHVYTGLLGLFMGGVLGYILDRVLSEDLCESK